MYDEHIHPESVIKEISLDKFLRETGIKNFKKQIKVKSNTGLQAARNPDGSYELSDFVIDTEIIKRFVYNEKITYTFRILPVEEEINDKYFNIIYYYDDGWQTKILEYTPTEENLILLKSNLTDSFEGTLTQVYQSVILNPIEEGCVTWILPTFHCTLTGECTPTYCDRCHECIGTTTAEFCNDDPVTVTYISAGPSTGGGPTSGTGPGSGASDGSSGSQTTNNEDEIATSPVFESVGLDAQEETPCQKLKNIADPTKGNLKLDIDWLRTKVNESVEFGVEVEMRRINGEYTFPTFRVEDGNAYDVAVRIGAFFIGSAHSHPKNSIRIPSFGDLLWLKGCRDSVRAGKENDVFLIVVTKGPNNTSNVYALKINDFEKLQNKLNLELNKQKYSSITNEKEKIKKILEDEKFYYNYSNNSNQNDVEKKFLQKYGEFGIDLYKANNAELTQWNKLDLNYETNNNNQSSLNVIPSPCN